MNDLPIKKKKKTGLNAAAERKKCLATIQRAVVYLEANDNGWATCISSGKKYPVKLLDGGHFYPKGSYPKLACCRENIHAQRRYDNRFAEGATQAYREGLIHRYGQAYVDRLDYLAKASKGSVEARKHLSGQDLAKYIDKRWTAQDWKIERLYWEKILKQHKYKDQGNGLV